MEFVTVNPNPKRRSVGDCVVRAICVATGKDWDDVYIDLMLKGFDVKDFPTANYIWGAYLKELGFKKGIVEDTCPDCYTVEDFIKDNPQGTFILGTGTHSACVKDGMLYDTWNSLGESPIYYFRKSDGGNRDDGEHE